MRAAREALRERAGGRSLECEMNADLRLGVEAVAEGRRKVRDDRLARSRAEDVVVVVVAVAVAVAEVMVGFVAGWPAQARKWK